MQLIAAGEYCDSSAAISFQYCNVWFPIRRALIAIRDSDVRDVEIRRTVYRTTTGKYLAPCSGGGTSAMRCSNTNSPEVPGVNSTS